MTNLWLGVSSQRDNGWSHQETVIIHLRVRALIRYTAQRAAYCLLTFAMLGSLCLLSRIVANPNVSSGFRRPAAHRASNFSTNSWATSFVRRVSNSEVEKKP